MRGVAPLGRRLWCAVWGGALLGVAGVSPAAAQTRTAAIRVQAHVRGITDADVIGAHAVAAPPAPSHGAAGSGAWRITTAGRGASVGIRVDGAGSLRICEAPGPGDACRSRAAPLAQSGGDGAASEFVVWVDGVPARRGGAGEPVRLTVAFIDF
jgi:hypothetical protein